MSARAPEARYGLVGRHLERSRSPAVFTSLTGLPYELFQLYPEELRGWLSSTARGLGGFNVTIPFKESVCEGLDQLSSDAEEIGAVNLVTVKRGKLFGENVDWLGFSGALRSSREAVRALDRGHALLIGAGGGARAALYSLEKIGGRALVAARADRGLDAPYVPLWSREFYAALDGVSLVVNCSPLGSWYGEEWPERFLDRMRKGGGFVVMDMVYEPAVTPLLGAVKQKNRVGGMRMLRLVVEESAKAWGLT